MPRFDWATIWRELVEASRAPADMSVRNGDWWARRHRHQRPPEERWKRPNMFLSQVLERLEPTSTVIDVGAGTGAWTIPLAEHAARVTAVEPSAYMMEILQERAKRAGLDNVAFIAARWEDIDVEPHSVVICSHGMYASPEIVPFFKKMHCAATRSCHLVMRVTSRNGAYQDLWRQLKGIAKPEEPHLIVAYNILHTLGIHANVVVQPLPNYWISESMDDAVNLARDVLRLAEDEAHDAELRDYLTQILNPVEGGLRWPGGLRAGMIWWDKEEE